MMTFRGVSLEMVAVVASLGDWQSSWTTEEERNAAYEKNMKFVSSVLGRELLAFLPLHACEYGCDTLELSVAELFVAKRPLNPRAMPMLVRQFIGGARKLIGRDDVPEALTKDPTMFFEDWATDFMDAGVELLHGKGSPEELFGDTPLLETWQRLDVFLKEKA